MSSITITTAPDIRRLALSTRRQGTYYTAKRGSVILAEGWTAGGAAQARQAALDDLREDGYQDHEISQGARR